MSHLPHLEAVLRYDYLRISLRDSSSDPATLNALHADFVEMLHASAFSEVVIVDLPSVERLDPELLNLLGTWERITRLAGLQFRLNGISQVVAQARETLQEKIPGPRSHLRPSLSRVTA